MNDEEKVREYIDKLKERQHENKKRMKELGLGKKDIPMMKIVGMAFWGQFIDDMLLEGRIGPTISKADFLKEVTEYWKSINSKDWKPKTPLSMIDYTDLLLDSARKYFRDGNANYTALFYSTYFEHRLNELVMQQAKKTKITQANLPQMLRDVNISGKCTWLLEILGIPSIASEYALIINQISEIRNSFVHYKWKRNELGSNDEKEFQTAALEKAEEVVSYLYEYEETHVYCGPRRELIKMLLGGDPLQEQRKFMKKVAVRRTKKATGSHSK